MSGKGSARRPQQISQVEMRRRWAEAFGTPQRSRFNDAAAWETVTDTPTYVERRRRDEKAISMDHYAKGGR